MSTRSFGSVITVVAVLVAAGEPAAAAQIQGVRCRKIIARSFAALIGTSTQYLATCHARARAGRDCNVLAGVASYERARERAKGVVNAFCSADDPARQNFTQQAGDLVQPLADFVRNRLEESGRTLQSISALPSGSAGRARRRCTRAIGRAREQIVQRMLHDSVRCETAVDRTATELGEIAGSCVGEADRTSSDWQTRVRRACAGVASADVGSCDPLPSCIVSSVQATGMALAHDVYGIPPDKRDDLCGNGVLDSGEKCDDGNRDDNDGCTNACRLATCGDGITETGVEQCDDGNNDDTDGCTPQCTLTYCGDGVVRKGVEECDDGAMNGTPGDVCESDCKFVSVTCPASGHLTATATLEPAKNGSTSTNVSGLTTELTYPSGLSIPGSGPLPVGDPTDPTTNPKLLDLDLYAGLVYFVDTDTLLRTLVTISGTIPLGTALPYEQAIFDCTPGDAFTAAALACHVTDAANNLGVTIDSSLWPDCGVVLTVGP